MSFSQHFFEKISLGSLYMGILFLIITYLRPTNTSDKLSQRLTSYLELGAAHSPELAVDRVNFFNQGLQDCVTDPLQNIQICCSVVFFSFLSNLTKILNLCRSCSFDVV